MKKLPKKLGSRKGETLIEALASVLIFTFASIILLSMISAAASINRTAKEADQALRSELFAAEAQEDGEGMEGSVEISVSGSNQPPTRVAVEYYGEGAGKLYTFNIIK